MPGFHIHTPTGFSTVCMIEVSLKYTDASKFHIKKKSIKSKPSSGK